MLVTVAAFAYRARVSRAFDAEREALGEAGAQSYLGFQLQRVNGLVSSQENRRRLLAAAEDHRVAAARWTEIVGDVSVDWALEHHEAITAAARLRDDIHSIGQLVVRLAWRSAPTRPPAWPRRWSPGWSRPATSASTRRASRSSSTTRSPGSRPT